MTRVALISIKMWTVSKKLSKTFFQTKLSKSVLSALVDRRIYPQILPRFRKKDFWGILLTTAFFGVFNGKLKKEKSPPIFFPSPKILWKIFPWYCVARATLWFCPSFFFCSFYGKCGPQARLMNMTLHFGKLLKTLAWGQKGWFLLVHEPEPMVCEVK